MVWIDFGVGEGYTAVCPYRIVFSEFQFDPTLTLPVTTYALPTFFEGEG
jgi:hypothetical protein